MYVQTACVVDQHLITEALGDVQMTGVLLTASETTRLSRLSQREIGSDDEPVTVIAERVVAVSGWAT